MTWVVELDGADAAACGPLRHGPGIEGCLVEGRLWLRGGSLDERFAAVLRRLPALGRHEADEQGRLVAAGARVPAGRLPSASWLPLHRLLPLDLPPVRPAGSGSPLQRAPLRLVREDSIREANLLEIPFTVWAAYASSAPAARLARLSFAASATGLALVRGSPLPSLPGRRLVEEGGVAVDAGWTWSPPLSPVALCATVGAREGDLVILSCAPGGDVGCQIVPGDALVLASRSGVRLSAAALGEGGR